MRQDRREIRSVDATETPADIGRRLQAMFDAVAAAPMPPTLEALVDQLERQRLSEEAALEPRYFDRRC
jgi:hypothetical protein